MVLLAFALAVTVTIIGNLLVLKFSAVREPRFPRIPES